MKLFEYKGINEKVKSVAELVGNAILNDCQSRKKRKSSVSNLLFVENTISLTVENFLKNGDVLTVNYIMYVVETRETYNTLVSSNEIVNSEADEDTNTIRVVSAFVGGKIAEDFQETIQHEVEHLFQYGRGMEKRKELYNKTVELLNLGNINIDAYYVGLCAYYSFKHEQDAFANQYYAYLKQNKPKKSAENIFNEGSHKNMEMAYNVLLKIKNRKETENAITYLGYTKSSFLKLVRYRKKRFTNKIRNVCKRYLSEVKEIPECVIRRRITAEIRRITESSRLGYDIEYSIESIFLF